MVVALRIGAWRVDPATNSISGDGKTVGVEARTMRLLLCLARRAGEVVSIDELLNDVWAGVVVTPDSVYQAVTSLRRLLGDDARKPAYIVTVPRLGYRLVAAVSPWSDNVPASPDAVPVATNLPAAAGGSVLAPRARHRKAILLGAGVVLALGAALLVFNKVNSRAAGAPPRSVAVLPFIDLTTQAMNEEYFADGMTEELIDRLSRIPGLRVPTPTASFYFKGKRIALAGIAKSLGVTYLLDGSVRRSGTTLRIAARLVRADDGYVIWSQSYDRSSADQLIVQDEIASEVTKALSVSIQ